MTKYSEFVGREIVTTRVLNAARDLVFTCFTTPEHLKEWWGPKGFSNTFHTCDPTPGGMWTFIMHGPDGRDYPNECRFLEVEPPGRIVLEHLGTTHYFLLTVTLDDFRGKTKITFRQLFDTAEECAKVKVFAAPANEENMDKLAAVLARI